MRRIILILAVGSLIYLFRRLLASRPASGAVADGGASREGGRMVRDRVCNTFLPAGSAVTARRQGSVHYFCSERCREQFLRQTVT